MNKKIAVIGGCNIDIASTINQEIKMYDSNPGSIKLSLGGVGRNIAQNLSQLGFKVSLFTAISNDIYGSLIKEKCKEQKIDLSFACFTSDYPQSIYLCVNDNKGDMVIGSSDMEIVNMISIDYLKANINHINEADYIVFDTNLTIEAIEYLLNNVTKPIFIDTVSVTKCAKLNEVFSNNPKVNIFCLKANKLEAEKLYGYEIKDEDDLNNLASKLTKKGIQNLCITLGKDGVFFASKVGPFFQAMQMDCPKNTKIINTTGAGDAFLAGLIYGYSLDEDTECIINYGLSASKVTMESKEAVSPNMDEEHLEKAFNSID